MKTGVLYRFFICVFLCATLVACAKSERQSLGTVVSVYDGDTITVLTTRKEQLKIRFYGIDAPELRQAYGAVAKKALSNLLFQKEVSAEIIVPKDKYGRVVAKIFVGDTCINEEMVRLGFAWSYQDTTKSTPDFEILQNEARAKKKGLWADGKPVSPWQYRQLEEEKRILKRIKDREKKEKEFQVIEK